MKSIQIGQCQLSDQNITFIIRKAKIKNVSCLNSAPQKDWIKLLITTERRKIPFYRSEEESKCHLLRPRCSVAEVSLCCRVLQLCQRAQQNLKEFITLNSFNFQALKEKIALITEERLKCSGIAALCPDKDLVAISSDESPAQLPRSLSLWREACGVVHLVWTCPGLPGLYFAVTAYIYFTCTAQLQFCTDRSNKLLFCVE